MTWIGLALVVIGFGVALYARWRMMHEDPRPGYVHDSDRPPNVIGFSVTRDDHEDRQAD